MTWKSIRKRRAYERNKYKTNAAFREQQRVRRKRNRKKDKLKSQILLVAFKENGCKLCNEKETSCMAAHHIEPDKKEYAIATLKSKPSLMAVELEKCICLCHNCHAKLHAGVLGLNLDLTPKDKMSAARTDGK